MVILKKYIAALTAVVLAVSLASCTEKGETPAPSGQLKNGELIVEENENILHLAVFNYDTLNPLKTVSNTVQECISLIYEPLFDFDEAFNPVSVLAKDYTVSPDGLQIEIQLASGILWQDGTAFSAGDVVYTMETIKNTDCSYHDDLRNIADVSAENENKIILTLIKPVLNVEAFLSFPVIKNGTELKNGTDFVPIGTGAYRLDPAQSSTNELVLTANTQWHGGNPAIGKIVLDVVKDRDAAVYAFEANEINALTSRTLDLKQSTPRGKFYIYSYTANTLLFLGINNKAENFMGTDVRRALGFMLNKQEMIGNEMYTHAVEVDVPVNPSAWFARKIDKSQRERADINQIMVSEGWEKKEDGFYYQAADNAPKRFKTSILVSGENDEKLRLAKRIAAQLTTAGLETEVKEEDFDRYIKHVNNGDFELFLGEVMLEKNMDPSFLTGTGNYFFYENPALNTQLSSAALTKDTDIRRQCFEGYMDMFLEEAPFVPLFFRTESVIYDRNISGNKMPTMFRPYRDVDTWYFSKKDKKSD